MKKRKAMKGEAGETRDGAAKEKTAEQGKTPAAVESCPDSELVMSADTEEERAGAVENPDPIEALQEKVAALEDSLLRAKADYRNLLRRSTIERSDAVRYANAVLMKSLLVVVDDFERSLEATCDSDNVESVIGGVRLVYRNLVKALQDRGLEPIEALNRPFDPNVHEALMQRASPDHAPGTVLEQVAKGYRLGDRVIRPAKVIVSRAADVESPEERVDADL